MSPPRRRKPQKRPTPRKRAVVGADFWGMKTTYDDPPARIPIADDATTLIRSLGPVPLPGRDTLAEHYFASVYDKAAALATALAAAGDLLDATYD